MSHAWVVEGCESPWGVFSAATPVLDAAVSASGPDDGGHCAGSQVAQHVRILRTLAGEQERNLCVLRQRPRSEVQTPRVQL